MENFDKIGFNKDIIKSKGFDYFKANVQALVKKGKIGERVEGKIKSPSDSEILKKYQDITGVKVESEKK